MPVNGGSGVCERLLFLHGTSDLLAAQLRLKELTLYPERGTPQEKDRRDDVNTDVCWCLLPPAHFSAWCQNRHGTLHGGLCLALFLAVCKAHLRRQGGTVGEVTHVSIQYMRPVFTTSALAVWSELHENISGANAAARHGGGVVRATMELYMQPNPQQRGGEQAEAGQEHLGLLKKGQKMDAALCCCRAFITIARKLTPAGHHL
ncbi:hypothetical protein TraAM80_01628 [Trypanosoma rangeli]|uniref:Thioesterase domain-containing protein n=1 Tax=Trypanosoma rangeli TaxID=5698 RepID=A0A3S5IS88_TRYRA|nr:uncharacterized protein TraAM80_01628 [Trypanosoma rangeli]RNF10285.1 hypothetical protein TraAM80_01628 [Trypanosoma rangeli]|eukprot:RNF10285.1 hypothetical protein TraAM80_01628 [Trypanosoma rangeli]